MATNSAYDALKQKVADLTTAISKKESEVSALQNDPNYPANAAIRTKLQNPPVQMFGDGGALEFQNWYKANKATIDAAYYAAEARDTALKARQGELASLKVQLADANKSLSDYEKNSPTLKAQVADDLLSTVGAFKNASDAIKNDRVLVIGIVVLIVAIIGIIFYAVKRKS